MHKYCSLTITPVFQFHFHILIHYIKLISPCSGGARILNGGVSALIFQQELREYPIQFTTYHRRPPPPSTLLWEEFWKIMKLMSKTSLNSTTDTPILSKQGSFWRSPTPHKSCKKVSLSRPPLLLLRWISRWCKEFPLTKRVNWIIAHNYGEPKCIFTNLSQLLAEKGKFWNPTLSDIMCSKIKNKKTLTKIADLDIIFLRRRYPVHWYQSLYPYITGSMPFRFFGPPCIYKYNCTGFAWTVAPL